MPTLVEIPKKTEIEKVPGPKKPKKPVWPLFLLFGVILFSSAVLVILLFFQAEELPGETRETEEKVGSADVSHKVPDWITVDLISVDGHSRRGEKLEAVRDLAVHYVGNAGTSAQANRNYFDSPDSTTSSHFIVGLEGEIIQCVPLDEKSSATNERNLDTISIEVCHPDATGEFSDVTRASLIRLLVWLCEEFDLDETNLIRHYDVTGKMCPLYYAEHPDAWEELKNDVKIAIGAKK